MLIRTALSVLICSILLPLNARAQPGERAEAASRPNIVFILADDLGYGDLGCFGRDDIATPNLDRMAEQGVRFTSHYANGPECSPTRAAFMTGRYQQWIGGLECAIGTGNVGRYDDAIRLREQHELGLPTTTPTIVRLLKDAGYSTAITGKWHLGYEPKFAPHLHGFDKTFYCIGGGMDYFHYLDTVAGYNLFRAGDPISAEGYFTDLATDEAIDFIDQQTTSHTAALPYFLYLPYTCPHSPFQGPDDRQKHPLPLDSPLWAQGNAPPDVYRNMIERMDECIGKVFTAIEDSGQLENTLIVFAGDNGGTRSARNAPFSGFKGSTYEGGIRVPAIARWDGVLPAGVECDQPCITFDLTASMAAVAGVEAPHSHPFEGIDLVGHVRDRKNDFPRTLYWRKPRGNVVWKAVRDGDLKYIQQARGANVDEYLFDLSNDLGEQNDLADERPAELERLRGLYNAWESKTRANRRGAPDRT